MDAPIQPPSSTSQPPPTKQPPSRHPHFFLNNVREQGLPSCFTPVLVRGLVAQEDKAELTVSWCGSPGLDNTLPRPLPVLQPHWAKPAPNPNPLLSSKKKGEELCSCTWALHKPQAFGVSFYDSSHWLLTAQGNNS